MPERLQIVPADHQERMAALDCTQSVLVQAPAGSGKTSLLTQRFLALLGQVDDPAEIVAITFTRAAAAEMRSRILAEIEKAASAPAPPANADPLSTAVLAHRALLHSHERGWNLLDQPMQLRISTIDSFCRELALQQPLISGLGGTLEIAAQPEVIYRRAARRVLEQMDQAPQPLREALATLLLWRDNNWLEMESLLVKMLKARDRWMRDFVLDREADLEQLRARLERPLARAVTAALQRLNELFDQAPAAREEILTLARFACEQTGGAQHAAIAEAAEFPAGPGNDPLALADAQTFYSALAGFLLTETGFRRAVNVTLGFPKERKQEKERMLTLLDTLRSIPGLEAQLLTVRTLPPARYSEDDWRIVRAAFTLLRYSAAELRVVFAEEGATDFTEIAQNALAVLEGEQEAPAEATLALVEGIRHLLVDEFQDTSRRQHALLARIVAAWPDAEGRTCFVVGDPMQSIYFFRDADAELFARVRDLGLEIPGAESLPFHSVRLTSNFRTAPQLVEQLNGAFAQIFAEDDGSGIDFAAASPARPPAPNTQIFDARMELHLEFIPQMPNAIAATPAARQAREQAAQTRTAAKEQQIEEIVEVIRMHQPRMEQAAQQAEGKYRVAVLGRARAALAPVADALRKAGIRFRAVDLEPLQDRPEIGDALALARALLNPEDRVAWLNVLRAPWCGLALADLHALTSGDDPQLLAQPVPKLLAERIALLGSEGRAAVERVLEAMQKAHKLRAQQPDASLGSWLRQVWMSVGGALTADATAAANLDLLWQALDTLPNAEQDLLGPALDAALAELTAQPDPTVDVNYGVQLMTIHKSKGLEFEVVMVPELQAAAGAAQKELLSWLERGVAAPDAGAEPTEFLIAPLQARGAERGSARAWVERMRSEREQQEMRRLLYVAATRAREELHLFARPAYKQQDGGMELAAPRVSLLKTAWPALGAEIAVRFAAWVNAQASTEESDAEEGTLVALAASGDLQAAKPSRTSYLLRLPMERAPAAEDAPRPAAPAATEAPELYARHEGGLRSRALGTAVHSFLEELARLRAAHTMEEARTVLKEFAPRVSATIRAAGFERAAADALAGEALQLTLDASDTVEAEWILAPHADAASELRWTGVLRGALRTVQADRIFRAGLEPFAEGDSVWWIVDYKTAHADSDNTHAAIKMLRADFAPQLKAYAEALRMLKGRDIEIRAALFYPRMKALDWWSVEPA
jgi:ATP-dependent exoDNAse (exonuclease V) beta subunit